MEIHAILSDFKKFQISNWNQSERDFKGSGVCMGMCLDWLRRIYSPTRRAKSKFGAPGRSAMYNEDEEVSAWKVWKDPKTKTRFDKQIATQETHRKVSKLNLTNMADDLIMPELNRRLLLDVRSRFGKSPKDLPSLEDSDLQAAFGAGLDGAQSWIEEHTSALFAAIRIEKMPELIASAHSSFQMQWMLDNPKKKSNYDKIKIDNSSTGRHIVQDEPIAGEFIWKTYILPNLTSMKDKGSAILSSGKVDGGGHDVAFHALAGRSYFYEPNFGEYHFDRAEDLEGLFCRLWNCVYRARGYNWAFWANYVGG